MPSFSYDRERNEVSVFVVVDVDDFTFPAVNWSNVRWEWIPGGSVPEFELPALDPEWA